MKALKSFSIPSLNFGANIGDSIKSADLPKEVVSRLQKTGFLSKPAPQKKAKKTAKK